MTETAICPWRIRQCLPRSCSCCRVASSGRCIRPRAGAGPALRAGAALRAWQPNPADRGRLGTKSFDRRLERPSTRLRPDMCRQSWQHAVQENARRCGVMEHPPSRRLFYITAASLHTAHRRWSPNGRVVRCKPWRGALLAGYRS